MDARARKKVVRGPTADGHEKIGEASAGGQEPAGPGAQHPSMDRINGEIAMYDRGIEEEIEVSVLALGVAYAAALIWLICWVGG